MDNLVPGPSQLCVAPQLLPGTVGIGVLDRAVGLGNRPVLIPEEVNAADGAEVAHDPDLQHRRRQPAVTERHPCDRLERRLSERIAEADHPPGVLNAWPSRTIPDHTL